MKKCLWAWLLCLPMLLVACGGGGGGGGTSAPAAVLSISAQPIDQAVTEGQPVQFSVTASNVQGYQWQVNAGQGWTDLTGASSSSYRVDSATMAMNGQQYRVTLTGRDGQLISSAVTLRVNAAAVAPTVLVSPLPATVVEGQGTTFNVTATGTSVSYQWQVSAGADGWTPVNGATGAQLQLVDVTLGQSGALYRVVVSNVLGTSTSDAALLTVTPLPVAPSITSQPASVSINAGQTGTFTVVAAGTPVPDLGWQISTDGGSHWTNIAGATGAAYSLASATLADDGKQFRAVASNSVGQLASQAAVLTVKPVPVAPTFTRQPENVSASIGSSVSLSAEVAGAPSPSLQWQTSGDGSNWFNVNGATSASYAPPTLSGADNGRLYRLVATNGTGSSISSVSALTVASSASGGPALSLFAGAMGGSGGLDGAGPDARLISVAGLAVTPGGEVLVADDFGHTVRKLSSSGMLSSWLGVYNQPGYLEGVGAAARFNAPQGLAMDSAGNVYLADLFNSSIRKITSAGRVSTLVSGISVSSVAVDASGVLYAAGLQGINRVAPDGSVTLVRGNAVFVGGIAGIAVAKNGDLWVTDSSGHTVQHLTAAGNVVEVFGAPGISGSADGNAGMARFDLPRAIAVDSATGSVFVTDAGNCTVRKITPIGNVSTVAGRAGVDGIEDGAGSDAHFSTNMGALAVAPSGDIYVGDGNAVRKLGVSGGLYVVSTVAGAPRYGASSPIGVVSDGAGNVYVADSMAHVVRKYTPDGGEVLGFAGNGVEGSTDGANTSASFSGPSGLAVDVAGNLYVADTGNHTIRKVTPAGVVSTLAGLAGQAGATDGIRTAARFASPVSVAVDTAGNVYVADAGNHNIRKILSNGTVSTFSGVAGQSGYADGTAQQARFASPNSIAIDGANRVFVADENRVIRQLDANGKATTLAGQPLPSGSVDGVGSEARFGRNLQLAAAGSTLYIADNDNGLVRSLDSSGRVSTVAGLAGQVGMRLGTDPRFNFISGMAATGAGKLLLTSTTEQSVFVLAF